MCNLCIGPLKEVEKAISHMQLVDLTRVAINILGIYFWYNMNLINQKNDITSIYGILKLCRMRTFSIEGKIVVFKTLAISKLVYLTVLTVTVCNF